MLPSATPVDVVSLGPACALMDARHEATDHGTRVRVLVDVAAIDHPERALRHQRRGFLEHRPEILPPAAAHEDRAARGLDDAMEVARVVRRIGLDDVRAELARQPYQRNDL